MSSVYVSKQFSEVATEEGVTLPDELETLMHFYHDTGEIICDSSLPTLNFVDSIVILKPLWLVEMCKSLLNADLICMDKVCSLADQGQHHRA